MKNEKLSKDDVDALMARIALNAKLNLLFNQLFSLYGAPKWLFEKKPFQDPEFLIGEWEKVVADYAEEDIMAAANRLFKFRKLQTFPTAAHILAELPDDAERVEHTPKPAVEKHPKPAELIPVWRKASVFAVAVGRWRSTDDAINAEGDKIRKQMSVGCFMWAECEVHRAEAEYLANDPRICDIYRDNPEAQFVACYQAGAFADIIAKIRANIRREWEPEKAKTGHEAYAHGMTNIGAAWNG